MCGKQVVLLGEADHGDGATVSFKGALVQRLITTCGFNALYFEAGTYDFLKVEELVRARQAVGESMLASAISALWNHDQELAPLVRFLLPRVNSGTLRVGGIDDQIGSLGAFYSLGQMPTDLSAALPQSRRSDCRDEMRRRVNYDYSDGHPHDAASIASLDQCLAEAEQRLRSRSTDRLAEDRLQMAAELRHAVASDFLPMAEVITRRDRRMYEELRWLMNHAGQHRKTIIWTASAHAAKSAAISGDYRKAPNLGALVHQAFGSRAFALGISAAGGAHYWSGKEPSRLIPQAMPDSVEGRALATHGGEAVYVPTAQLRKLGVAPGSFDRHQPRRAHWDQVFDGAIILRIERPPVRIP
jgi:erythromycin esterase-like protein